MKRILIAAITAALILSLAACSGNKPSSSTPVSDGTIPSESSAILDSGSNARIGLGFVATTSDSNAAGTETTGNAKFNVAACALSVDENGNILDVRFDTVEAGIGFDTTGALMGDANSEIKTMRELGNNYGMAESSGTGTGWHEQINTLEEWMRGKSINEVMAMKVTARDEKNQHVPNEDALKDSVTISVTDQLRALEKAYADATGTPMSYSSDMVP